MSTSSKLYAVKVWAGLTDNYHSGGTILIKAANRAHAKRRAIRDFHLREDAIDVEDIHVAKDGDVFKNAGCC